LPVRTKPPIDKVTAQLLTAYNERAEQEEGASCGMFMKQPLPLTPSVTREKLLYHYGEFYSDAKAAFGNHDSETVTQEVKNFVNLFFEHILGGLAAARLQRLGSVLSSRVKNGMEIVRFLNGKKLSNDSSPPLAIGGFGF
jgi:hypothetical protein